MVRRIAWIAVGVLLVACGGVVSSSGSPGASGAPGAAGAGGSAGVAGGCAAGSVSCGGACCSGSCESGRCVQVLASGRHYPEDIAVDASSVYWIESGGPSCVMRVPLAGGAPVAVTPAKKSVTCAGLAVDSNGVYFIEGDNVMRAPLAGGAPATLASAQPLYLPNILAIHDASIYWNNGGSSPATIMRVGLAGGTPQVVAQGDDIADGFAVDGASVYWAEFGVGPITTVTRTPLGGGPSAPLATAHGIPQIVAADATNVYFETPSALEKVPLSGGTPTKLATLADGTNAWTSIAVDGHYVYYVADYDATTRQGTLSKVPVAGGAPITLAAGQGVGRAMTVDATSVYWTVESSTDGRVMKLTPK